MHSMKITFLSLALLFSCSSFSSAPAQAAQPNNDELKIQEIPLMSVKNAMKLLAMQTKHTKNFLKDNPTFDKKLIQDMHQAGGDTFSLLAHQYQTEQHITECAQNGDDVSAQKQQLQALYEQYKKRGKQEFILIEQTRANNKSYQAAHLLRSQRNLYWFQALSLRAEKEDEKIKHEKEKIKMETQINQLQEKLKQYEPGFQPEMEEQIEGMPLVPGGEK